MSNTQHDNLCGERSASAEREIIRIDGLNKAFGEIKAVRDLSFRVCRGELFAFLGVNGAGKSTTISIISGQLRRDGGSVTILGIDRSGKPPQSSRTVRHQRKSVQKKTFGAVGTSRFR